MKNKSKFFFLGTESCGSRFEIGTSGIRNSNDDCLTSQHVNPLRRVVPVYVMLEYMGAAVQPLSFLTSALERG